MSLSEHRPLERFTGLAEQYAKHRPSYPDAALDHFLQRAALPKTGVIVDVGAGTGISARWIARRGFSVIGIEPNDEMRAAASAIPEPEVSYQNGQAESTGVEPESADAIVAAQAFHWFEPAAALREFARVLKP